ncbi:MAG: lysophospholipase [Anaerolineae bacterium]|nr:lysophospholipase [Anaerolineae bacterium]
MQSEYQDTTFRFTDPEGYEIFVYCWGPPTGVTVKAVVQIEHGAAEHALRYERVARVLNQHGYIVYADDHRGHGKTAGTLDKAGICGPDGWNGMVKDAKQLTGIIKEKHPGLPVFLFGHSMGSFMAQQYIQNWGEGLAGAILCGSTGLALVEASVLPIAEQVAQGEAGSQPSAIFAGLFASVNEPFEPVKTPFDWLSRDETEVQKYIDDPWCGFAFTNGMTYEFVKGTVHLFDNEARIPKNLPIYIISGEMDPVGANNGVITLVNRYQNDLVIEDISYRLYPGARHEILNETNRDEVQADLITWLDGKL